MAKQVQKKAGKDYPQQGIVKGEMYWYADVKTGPRSKIIIRSKTMIPRSRLTGSEFLSTAYDLSDRIDAATTVEELEDIKQGFEDLRDETQEKLDNMPEGLQQGDTGQLLQERIDQIESLLTELEEAINEAGEDDSEDPDPAEDDIAAEDAAEAERVRAAVETHVSSSF